MDFIGQGTRLAPGDVGEVARKSSLETAVLLAFMEVEAAGTGFDAKRRPKTLPEPHRFYAELGPGAKRDRAVREGLAYQRWGTKPYPKTFDLRFDRIRQGMRIDADAALRACSWGLGQVLGSNCRAAGHPTALAMVESAMVSERNQLQHMVNFLDNEKISPLLRGKDFSKASSWEPAVRRYNGPGYAKHNYHGRAASAYVRHAKKEGTVLTSPGTILYPGSRGELVMNMQRDLQSAGWLAESAPDGIYGPATERAVRAYQSAQGLTPDGRYGPATAARLAETLKALPVDLDPEPPLWEGQDPELESIAALVEAFAEQQQRELEALLAAIRKGQ